MQYVQENSFARRNGLNTYLSAQAGGDTSLHKALSKTRHCIVSAISAIALLLSAISYSETLYKSVDKSGRVTYSDHLPSSASRVEVLKLTRVQGVAATKALRADNSNAAPQLIAPMAGVDTGIVPVAVPPLSAATPGASSSSSSGGKGGGGSASSLGTASKTQAGKAPIKSAAAITPVVVPPAATPAAVTVGATAPVPVPVPAPVPVPVPVSTPTVTGADFIAGVGIHAGPQTGDVGKFMGLFNGLAVGAFRMNYRWTWVERQKGQLQFDPTLDGFLRSASTQGHRPLIVLGVGNPLYDGGGFPTTPAGQDAFVHYAVAVAQHFKGVVHHYEIWNEWNAGMGSVPRVNTGSALLYATLLSKVHAALKAVDSEIVVLGGAMVGPDPAWSYTLFHAGGANMMDGFSVHPYNYPNVPERAIEYLESLEAQAKALSGGREVPLYVSEIGWPTYLGTGGVAPSVAANYLARFYLLAPMYGYIKGAWWYDLRDDGNDPAAKDLNFGLIHNDWSPKPGACAMTEVGKLLSAYRPVSAHRDGNNVWIAKYTNGTDSLFAIWTEVAGATVNAVLATSSPSGARINAHGICQTISISGNGSTSLGATISNNPMLVSTMADGIVLR